MHEFIVTRQYAYPMSKISTLAKISTINMIKTKPPNEQRKPSQKENTNQANLPTNKWNKRKASPFPLPLCLGSPWTPPISTPLPLSLLSLPPPAANGRPSVATQSSRRNNITAAIELVDTCCRPVRRFPPSVLLYFGLGTAAFHQRQPPPPLPALIVADRSHCCRPATVHRPSRH